MLLRLVDWSQGHPSPLGSGNISLEAAVDSAQHPTSYENQPFSCHLNLNGRPVGVLTGQLHVIWSGTNKPTKPLERSKSSRILSSPAKHFLPARAQTPRATRAPAASLP